MLKYFSASCLAIISICSAYLTILFMFELGSNTQTMIILAIIGIVMDLTKSTLPLYIMQIANKNIIPAVALGFMLIGLIALSFTASVYSIDNGFNSNNNTSDASEAWNTKLAIKQNQLERLQQQYDNQIKLNRITKSDTTMNNINNLTNDISKLLDEQPKSIINAYSNIITIIISLLIEFITITLAICLKYTNYNNVNVTNSSNLASRNANDIVVTKSKSKGKHVVNDDTPLSKFMR